MERANDNQSLVEAQCARRREIRYHLESVLMNIPGGGGLLDLYDGVTMELHRAGVYPPNSINLKHL